ncbi:MFS transporter [Nocardioides sp. MAHUQ-72]|uniref:MFS transporter n=1 Tax=unclassified Nocardioides TaxID=2615069 RepID=UPI00361EB916
MSAGSQVLAREPVVPSPAGRLAVLARHPVLVTAAAAAVLHVLWWWLLATSGGDLAAQDAWAEFARTHPGSAYNLAWYGGMHPVSYSALSPYVMATLGVRTTMMLAGTASAALLALLLVRSKALTRPLWPALFGAVAFAGNAVSGRVTFGLGLMFGLAALATVFAWPTRWRTHEPRHRWPRAALACALSGAATAASPVAGLFLGLTAAALWLGRRRPAAYALGLPPVAVVALSSWLFPFSGQQPMPWASMILPVAFAAGLFVLAPPSWRTVRIGAVLYGVGVVAVWLVPSQIGTNITRLGLVFGGVLVVAVGVRKPSAPVPGRRPALLHAHPQRFTALLVVGVLTSSIWQVATAARDSIDTRPDAAWTVDVRPLVNQLQSLQAGQARVEVVPAASHREASALAPYVNLARGWNRQADAERNPIFYTEGLLTKRSYRAWLDRWAVHYVVLSTGEPDQAGVAEAALVSGGLRYLHEVWADDSWRLYAVQEPTPLADPPAVVTSFTAAQVVIRMPRAGEVLVRIPDSPWLSLVDEEGQPLPGPVSPGAGLPAVNVNGCLSEAEQPHLPGEAVDKWTVLHAPRAGTYRIAAPYKLPRGTSCPDEGGGEDAP